MRGPRPRPSPGALAPGALVGGGKYRLERALGSGGMGEVWAATNRATGAEVAVKIRRPESARDRQAARFRHEARLAASLSHRGIVRIFDLVEDADGPVLVMELLRGQTLGRLLAERGPLGNRESIAITLPLLSALAHAHDRGVVHRDVKPANVFLAREPDGQIVPKLLDFGIAKLPESDFQTDDGSVLGTPEYMAPERIRGLAEIDGRSDLFSVGALLYELLTGACPFAAPSPAASLALALELVVDPDPRIHPRVWLEVKRALAKNAYERHPSAHAMADALRAAAGVSEADLEACLREAPALGSTGTSNEFRQPPLPGRDTPARPARAPATRLVGLGPWSALALLAGGIATLLALAFGRHSAEPPPLPSHGSECPAAVSSGAAPPELPAKTAAGTGVLVPTSPSSLVAPAPHPSARSLPAAHRPKSVATTPGF